MTEDDVRAACAPLRDTIDLLENMLVGLVGRERYWRNRAEQAEEALDDTNGTPDLEERPEPVTLAQVWSRRPDLSLRDGSPYHQSGADKNDWRL